MQWSTRRSLDTCCGFRTARLQSWSATSLQTQAGSSIAPSLLPPHCTEAPAACTKDPTACPRLSAPAALSQGIGKQRQGPPCPMADTVHQSLGWQGIPLRGAATLTAAEAAAVGTDRGGMCKRPLARPPPKHYGICREAVLRRSFLGALPAPRRHAGSRPPGRRWKSTPSAEEAAWAADKTERILGSLPLPTVSPDADQWAKCGVP